VEKNLCHSARSVCPQAKKCGGCQMLNLSYEEQLAWKERTVKRLIGRFCRVLPIRGMETPYHYRNKVQAAFGLDRTRHTIISGVYQSTSHRIVPIDRCAIEDEAADAIIVTIRQMLPSFKIRVYDERSGTGWLRHVLVRRGFATGEIMVVLVAISPVFSAQRSFTAKLLALHPEITTVVLNVNDTSTPLFLGSREKVLYGSGYIEDELCGLTFRISPRSFYQINPTQTERLYSAAVEFAGLHGTETVLDAYCGIGTIGLIASRKAGRVLGVEINRDAVRDAIANARRNDIKNTWFTAADAGEYMTQMALEREHVDVVFMDPPRAGSDPRFLRALLRLKPDRIVYISCNPETLARDLETLTGVGYRAELAQPVDMFPQTKHVETVVQLSKGNISSKNVKVEFSLEDMDMSRFQQGATYEQIQDWVQGKYGFHVTHLNIAQVKRKYGIIERENYNKPKSPDSRQPGCSEEKVKAIIEAFKAFQMI